MIRVVAWDDLFTLTLPEIEARERGRRLDAIRVARVVMVRSILLDAMPAMMAAAKAKAKASTGGQSTLFDHFTAGTVNPAELER